MAEKPRVLVIGGAVVDFLCQVTRHVGTKYYVRLLTRSGGGGGRNVALAAKRLGLDVSLLTVVGRDFLADEIVRELTEEGVDLHLSFVDNMPTGFSLITDYGIFSLRGANESFEITELDLSGIDWVYIASIPEKVQRRLCSLLKMKSAKIKIFLNPGPEQFGTSELYELFKLCTVLQINETEAMKLVGPGDLNDLLLRLHQLGPKLVIITAGEKGAFAYDGTRVFHQPPYPTTEVLETTGAGDAFAAGVLAGLAKGLPLSDALKLGAANAAEVVRHLGATGFLSWNEALRKAGLEPVSCG